MDIPYFSLHVYIVLITLNVCCGKTLMERYFVTFEWLRFCILGVAIYYFRGESVVNFYGTDNSFVWPKLGIGYIMGFNNPWYIPELVALSFA